MMDYPPQERRYDDDEDTAQRPAADPYADVPHTADRLATTDGQPTAGPSPRPRVLCVADVAAERVQWLWDGWIARGKLAVIDGDPGKGKSTLTTDLAARISTGTPLPGGTRTVPAAVVLLSAEDGVGDTIRPRLEAAGADTTRVFVFDSVLDAEGTPRPPSIPGDIPYVEALVTEKGAVLVVIDPLMAFLGAGVDAHRDQDVRRALHSLAAVAERTGAAIVIVRHLNKSGGPQAIYRGGGSIGIIGAARSGLLVASDPDDDTRRIVAVTSRTSPRSLRRWPTDWSTMTSTGAPVSCGRARPATPPTACWPSRVTTTSGPSATTPPTGCATPLPRRGFRQTRSWP